MSESRERVVLIIDDDPDVTRLMKVMLSWVVERVVTVNDSRVGLEAARAIRPDLILCDINMPELNGFDLRRQLTADPVLAEIPFVFVSGQTRVDAQLTGFRLGATAYLTKPINRDTLVATVLHQLQRKPTLTAVPAVEPAGGLSAPSTAHLGGRLDVVPMPDLLQMLEASRSTGVLTITSDGATAGEMTLAKGRVVDARSGPWTGEDALLSLLQIAEGLFTFTRQLGAPGPPGADAGGWDIARVLIDAAWISDEFGRLGAQAPGPEDMVAIESIEAVSEIFAQHGNSRALREVSGPITVADLTARMGVSSHRCRVLLGLAAERRAVRILRAGSSPPGSSPPAS